MTHDKEHFRDLCMAYALGALEGDEAESFRLALADADEEGLAAYAEALMLARNLALAAPPAEPSTAVKDRLMSAVAALEVAPVRPAPARPAATAAIRRPAAPPERPFWKGLLDSLGFGEDGFRRGGYAVAFGALALAVGAIAWSLSLNNRLQSSAVALAESHAKITALEDSVSRRDAMLEVLLSHNMQVVVLAGQQANPQGYGKVLWCPKRKAAILHVSNLPPVPGDKEYQLWLIKDGRPMDAGVFKVKRNTWDGDLYRISGLAEVDRKKIEAWAITLEPKGGVPQPTGEMFLKGAPTEI